MLLEMLDPCHWPPSVFGPKWPSIHAIMGPQNISQASLTAIITTKTHFQTLELIQMLFAMIYPCHQQWPHPDRPTSIFGQKQPSIHAIMGPKNISRASLTANITANNSFSDVGAHTNVFRNGLPFYWRCSHLDWSISKFDPKIAFFLILPTMAFIEGHFWPKIDVGRSGWDHRQWQG